jgi:EAL domain-containing protein (putative c-di-GMP-specific phosphodiesterase class I)
MGDAQATIARLTELKALGVRIAVDDFGTGYSSLSYLRQFPIDELKIAKPFIDDMADDPDSLAVARGIVELGRSLSMQVLAEGIEDPAQAELLRAIGCELGQGYLFARPLDAASADAMLTGAAR